MSDPNTPSPPEPPPGGTPGQPEPKPATPAGGSPWQASANPFSDVSPTVAKPLGDGNIYAPIVPPPQWRGDSINGLAVAGLVFSILSAVCCALFGIVGLSLAIPAYFMAQHDLALYSHELHPVLLSKLKTSKSLALAAIIVGAIGFVINLLCFGLQMGAGILDATMRNS